MSIISSIIMTLPGSTGPVYTPPVIPGHPGIPLTSAGITSVQVASIWNI